LIGKPNQFFQIYHCHFFDIIRKKEKALLVMADIWK